VASAGQAFERIPTVLYRLIAQRHYLRAGGEVYELDEVGFAFWSRLDRVRTIAIIAGELATEFDHPPQSIEQDLAAYADELQAAGLIRLSSQAGVT
jgi:hypothetical protein